MKNIILTIALVVLPAIALGAPQVGPSPQIQPDTPCAEACYAPIWDVCVDESMDMMRLCLSLYPGRFCELLFLSDVRYRCQDSTSNCIQSCRRNGD